MILKIFEHFKLVGGSLHEGTPTTKGYLENWEKPCKATWPLQDNVSPIFDLFLKNEQKVLLTSPLAYILPQ